MMLVPSPWPISLVVKKGSKILSRTSLLIPIPVSDTSSRTWSPSWKVGGGGAGERPPATRAGSWTRPIAPPPLEGELLDRLQLRTDVRKVQLLVSELQAQKLGPSQDPVEQVIEIVRDPGGQLAERPDPLRVHEAFLGPVQGRVRLLN